VNWSIPALQVALALGMAAVVLEGCGLEATVDALAPPDTVSGGVSDQDDFFRFQIDSDNDEDGVSKLVIFRGIEIYYRFYGDSSEANLGLTTQTELVSNLYQRMASTDDTRTLVQRPLIPVSASERGKQSTITLNFLPLSLATPAAPEIVAEPDEAGALELISGTTAIEPRRGAWDTNGDFKAFLDDYEHTPDDTTTDTDISAADFATWPPASGTIWIAVYVLSYGKQGDDLLTDAYSKAVSLGVIEIPVVDNN
jgi:hypothetical protein